MIYLDTASTTRPSEKAKEAVLAALNEFGNPSSLHGLGINAEKIVENSRACIARRLGTDKKNIFFTSGGTEANNTAVFGTAYAMKKRGTHVITSAIEHPSVLESFKRLESEGFRVTYIGAGKSGAINLDELENALDEETTLVSIMAVNNETGIIQPVKEIAELVHEKSPIALFHSDCVQAFGKMNCSFGADLISISSHKIHGPKGTGAICVCKGRLNSLLCGGEQQGGFRPGTENVPGIAGFGAAASEDYGNCDMLYDALKTGILSNIDNAFVNGDEAIASKYVLNVSFAGVKAEVLLHSLETHGIYVSTGSACSSHKPEPSHVLSAMGVPKNHIDGAVRFSFDNLVTLDDINETVEALKKEVSTIRRYVR